LYLKTIQRARVEGEEGERKQREEDDERTRKKTTTTTTAMANNKNKTNYKRNDNDGSEMVVPDVNERQQREMNKMREEIASLRRANENLRRRFVNSDSQSNLSNNLLKKLAPLKELAMDSLEEGVTIADFTHPLQPLVFANQGFTEITGYTVDETVGKNCRFLQGPETEPEVVRKIKYAVMNGHSITCRLKNYRKNGEMFINNLSLKPIRNDDEKVTHYVGIQSDVTSLVDAENAEIEALKRVAVANAATESKSKFLAHMSHEIRTPLNGLIAVGQLLESTKLDREQRDLVTTMQSSGETLQALISDILDFSRVEAEKLSLASEPFNPEALIANVLEIVGIHAGRLKLNVGYHVDEGVPKTVLGDAMRVQQVLLNSINNAIKFTEQGDIMVRLYIGMAPKKGGMQRVHSVLAMNDDWITPLSELQHMCPHFLPKKENVGKEEEEEQQKCPFHNQHSSKQKALQQEQQQNTIKRSHELSEATTKVTTNISTHSETFGSGNDADEVNAHDKPVYLHFYVKDTGIGLPPDMIREVFNSFQQVDDGTTRKFDGSGLGLAISKKLCEAMGGTIWAESEGLGKGSTFHFCIKCQTSREKDSSIESKIVQKIGEFSALKHHEESWIPKKISMSIGKNDLRSTILIFDESRMICKTIESSLKQWNIKTDVVSSAQKLFEKLDSDIEEHPNEKNRKYGCIIAQRSLKFERELIEFGQKHKLISDDGQQFLGAPKTKRKTRKSNSSANEKSPKEKNAPLEVAKVFPAMILLTWPAAAKVFAGGIAGTLARLHERNEEANKVIDNPVDEAERKRVLKLCDAVLKQSNFETVTKPVRYGYLQQAISRIIANDEDGDEEDECITQKKEKSPTPESSEVSAKIRVLLAEDHLINMKVAKAVLSKCGYDDIVWAKDGLVALELIEKEEKGVDAFDLILMDLHMPRCGGLECVRKIREKYPDSKIPIVAVTADAMTESRDICMKQGFTGWITKPFRIEQLKTLVDDVLAKKNETTNRNVK